MKIFFLECIVRNNMELVNMTPFMHQKAWSYSMWSVSSLTWSIIIVKKDPAKNKKTNSMFSSQPLADSACLMHWHLGYFIEICNFIFKVILMMDGWDISTKIALIWMSPDLTDDKSTLVQVMAWCHQAPSHYLSQCWPRSTSMYGINRPQWVDGCSKYASCEM